MGRSLNPLPGSPRPVQRGTAVISSASNSVDVTVNSVDVLKASLHHNGGQYNGPPTTQGDYEFSCEVINSTTIRFSRLTSGGTSPSISIKWELLSWH